MSTYLTKKLGHFLSSSAAASLLVADARDIVEAVAEGESTLFDGLDAFGEDFLNTASADISPWTKIILRSALSYACSAHATGQLSGCQLLSSVFCYDTFEGFMFCEGQANTKRRNDPMDWLEQSTDPSEWVFSCKQLDRPAISWGGYVPRNGLTAELAALLPTGTLPAGKRASIESQIGTERFNELFRPEVDPMAWLIVSKLGMQRADVTRKDFEAALIPSIVTTFA